MNNSNPLNQEAVDGQLIEEVLQLEQISLGEDSMRCQVCGSALREGDTVAVYVFRPAEAEQYDVGHVMCNKISHKRIDVFTVGIQELLIRGRVGWCSDVATQSSWPVLIAPKMIGVSAAATGSLRRIAADNTTIDMTGAADRNAKESSRKVSVGEARGQSDQINAGTVYGSLWGER